MTVTQRLVGLVLIIVSLALLYPGVTEPVITITGDVEKSEMIKLGMDLVVGENGDRQSRQMVRMLTSMLGLDQIPGTVQVYQQTRSIWGTVMQLYDGGDKLVAFLVMLFSVVIPLTKQLMQLICVLVTYAPIQQPLLSFNAAISKWSMADVFLMSIIVTYMAVSASGHSDQLVQMQAGFEPGFYFFLAYCVFSIAASTLFAYSLRPVAEAD